MAELLPQPTGPQIDPRTNTLTEEWKRYYQALEDAISATGAPSDAQYYVATSNSDLSNERNLGGLASGFLKITVAAGEATPSTVATIPAASVSGIIPLAQGGTGSDLSGTGGSGQVLKQASAGANVTVGALGISDVTNLTAGTYTPSVVLSSNLTSITVQDAQYLRVGTVVTVGGSVTANVTATALTILMLSLPVASAYSSERLGGAGACGPSTPAATIDAIRVTTGSSSGLRAYLQWYSTVTGAVSLNYTFTYLIA